MTTSGWPTPRSHPDETAAACTGFLRFSAGCFVDHGIPLIERVATDNAKAYRVSHVGPNSPAPGLPVFQIGQPENQLESHVGDLVGDGVGAFLVGGRGPGDRSGPPTDRLRCDSA